MTPSAPVSRVLGVSTLHLPQPPSQRSRCLELAPMLAPKLLNIRTDSLAKFIECLLSHKEFFKVLWKRRRIE